MKWHEQTLGSTVRCTVSAPAHRAGSRSASALPLIVVSCFFALLLGCGDDDRPINQDTALTAVLALPVVQAFSKRIEAFSSGSIHAIVYMEGESVDYWSFYVGEDHPDHTVRIYSLDVKKSDGAIFLRNTDDERMQIGSVH